MSQRTECDRCHALVPVRNQAFEIGIGPLRAPEPAPESGRARPKQPSAYDKYLQLCFTCHAALGIFLDVEKK